MTFTATLNESPMPLLAIVGRVVRLRKLSGEMVDALVDGIDFRQFGDTWDAQLRVTETFISHIEVSGLPMPVRTRLPEIVLNETQGRAGR